MTEVEINEDHLEEVSRPKDLPKDAEKIVEYQINKEDTYADIVDCDHRDTLEEAKQHFFLEEEHWSIEKVTMWGKDGLGIIARTHQLVSESPRPKFKFTDQYGDEKTVSFPTLEGAEAYAKRYNLELKGEKEQ